MPSARAISIMDVHICQPPNSLDACRRRRTPCSTIHCLLGPVEWPVPIENAVAGSMVAVELVHLAVLLELGLVLVYLLGARGAVVIAEYAEQRAAEVLRHLDWRDGRLGIGLLLTHHHAAAPEVGAGIDVRPLAGIDEGVPATRTGSENANLAVVVGLGAHPLHCGLGVPHHLGVWYAAVGAHFGGDIVWVELAGTLIEVSANCEMAVMCELTRRLDVKLTPARQMVDKHDFGNRGSL